MKKSVIIILVSVLILIGIGILLFSSNNAKENEGESTRNNTDTAEETTTPTPVIKEFAALRDAKEVCTITEYFTYGTSLCLSGTLTDENFSDIESMSVVLRQAYTNPDGSIEDKDLYTFPLYITAASATVSFSSYQEINNGIFLETFEDGEYCMLIKVSYTDGTGRYLTAANSSGEEDICYYTLTKKNTNQKIDFSFSSFDGQPYISFLVEQSPLPADVYDIVIDPGHGGNDAGAINGTYYEADITLGYALGLKTALEDAGYKVLLTRDGTESPDEPMAYNMYNEDGRVNIACSGHAKYCLSIHLNSNADYVSRGGLQIYVSCRADSRFAGTLAKNIVASSGTHLSPMIAFRLEEGIYSRSLSEEDIEDSKAEAATHGYMPYDIDTNTDYYYMIRELGGIATGAYVDGRNSQYGANLYYDSIQGTESYIIELGFISIDEDLNHILSHRDGYIKGIVDSFTENFPN